MNVLWWITRSIKFPGMFIVWISIFYKYEIKLGDQYVDIYDYINNNEFEFSIKATKENNSTIFKIPPFFPAISVDEINTSYIDIINDKLIMIYS